MKRPLTASVVLLAGALALTGCAAADAQPEVTTIPTASPSATATPEVDIAEGTRANPLEVGESTKLEELSTWSVGAEAPTQVNDGYVVLPVHIEIDWDAARAQGVDAENEGLDPWGSLYFSYVTADGHSYDSNNYPDADIPNELYEVGTVYPPTSTISANVAIAVPNDQIPGGVWRVENANGNGVFIIGAPAS